MDGGGEGGAIAEGDEAAGMVIDACFAGAVNVIGDGGRAAQERLRHGAGEAFAITWVGQQVGSAEVSGNALGGHEAGDDDAGLRCGLLALIELTDPEAKRLGALTIGISCTPDSLLSQEVHIPIAPLPGPEIVTGSTRMKAGTATKLVLNMLSTGAMIRLGYVYGNLMVNVQPTNEKLRDRATRIIMDASGVAREVAARLLDESGRSVRTAIVMARRGMDRESAELLLAAHRGRVSAALGEQG